MHKAECDDGVTRMFDIASINTGSTPVTLETPGAQEHAVAVKPVAVLLSRWQAFLEKTATQEGNANIVVVGGGAGGVELAFAIKHRLSTRNSPHATCTLMAPKLLANQHKGVQERVVRLLKERGIRVELDSAASVTADAVHTRGGKCIAADFTIFATSASAPDWLSQSGLAVDAQGFVAVNQHLQSLSHPNVFAAGDAATLIANPAPKAGVYAVRQGPILHENLRDVLNSRFPSSTFTPQRRALYIIATADKRGILSYGSLALYGRLMWRIKDAIDRRFMKRYSSKSA